MPLKNFVQKRRKMLNATPPADLPFTVFIGETRNRDKGPEILGMHNWIRVYAEEKNGNVDYHGYIPPRANRRGTAPSRPHEDEQMVQIQFSWDNPEDDQVPMLRLNEMLLQ